MFMQEKVDDRDPLHWKLGLFYFNVKDKRVFVPKRVRFLGWTLNFAHTASYFIIAIIFAFIFYKVYQA